MERERASERERWRERERERESVYSRGREGEFFMLDREKDKGDEEDALSCSPQATPLSQQC